MDEAIEVRDARGNNRFMIDNAIIDVYGPIIGPYGLALYIAICRHSDRETQESYPRVKTLAKETGMSGRQVHNKLEQLCELGLLRVVSGKEAGQRNVYVLLQVYPDPDKQREFAKQLGYAPRAEGCEHGAEEYAPRAEGCAPSAETSEQTHLANTTNKLTEPEGDAPARAPAGKRKGKPRDPLLDHPAVIAYRDEYHYWPDTTLRPPIAEAVGDDAGAVALWARILRGWHGAGWGPRNIDGMLDWFRRGEIPGTNGKGPPRKHASNFGVKRQHDEYAGGKYAEYIEH
ncbi:MAG: helix-turn-helix domain-containing protein [Opitutaceae bacterium]|nr:helix-turn-helix domain-containing protein [Opitutaceae bacterium]